MRSKLLMLCLLSLAVAPAARGIDTVPRPVSPDGIHATCDLLAAEHLRNVGGSDGAGLCVYTSNLHSAKWQNVKPMYGIRKFAEGRPGGSYPEKLDKDIATYCARQGVAVPGYVQHTGGDLDFLKLVLKTGRMPGVTYAGNDGFYAGPIGHMVNLAYLDDSHAAIIDNNRPGSWVWMTAAQFENRWLGLYDTGRPMVARDDNGNTFQVGGGWAFVWLAPPPPPYAANLAGSNRPTGPDGLPTLPNFGVQGDKLPPPAAPKATNFGIDSPRVRTARSYALNGTDVTKTVAAAGFADDSDRETITYVGCDPVTLTDAVKTRVNVQRYDAAEWPVKQFKLSAGATVRTAAKARQAEQIGVIAPDKVTAETVAALVVGAPVKPDPVTPPVLPTPVPVGALTITLDDLTPAARAKLDAAGVGGLSLTVTPKPAPQPMPGPAPKANGTEGGPLLGLAMVGSADDGTSKPLGTEPTIVTLDTLAVTYSGFALSYGGVLKLLPGTPVKINGAVTPFTSVITHFLSRGFDGVNFKATRDAAGKIAEVEFTYFVDKNAPKAEAGSATPPAAVEPAVKCGPNGVPLDLPPAGKRWVKLGTIDSEHPWKLEDEPASCPNGRCPLIRR